LEEPVTFRKPVGECFNVNGRLVPLTEESVELKGPVWNGREASGVGVIVILVEMLPFARKVGTRSSWSPEVLEEDNPAVVEILGAGARMTRLRGEREESAVDVVRTDDNVEVLCNVMEFSAVEVFSAVVLFILDNAPAVTVTKPSANML
jgi:hypothetical protein